MTRAGTSARFRQRKLSTKQTLAIVREDQVDKVDDDGQRNIPKVDTGVEKGEEIEHHLQAAISASQAAAVGGRVAQIYIPTPDTIQSSIHYDNLYSKAFSKPATYIRFSSTVEDCTGCRYNMTEEDDEFLRALNTRTAQSTKCAEDTFEEVMDLFERTAQAKQPFAVVDSPPVLSYEELEISFDDTVEVSSLVFTKEIYQHWKKQRLKRGNKPQTPSLKFETGQERDDSDPYVCFRRREVRAIRKTRGRDAQSSEKLRKLRRELELGREGLSKVKRREITKKETLAMDKQIFELRLLLKEEKRKHGIKDNDEELLVNQKSQRKRLSEAPQIQRPPPTQLRIPSRQDGRSAEADLIPLQDVLAEKENDMKKRIEEEIKKHRSYNTGFLDLTRMPLTPAAEPGWNLNFRAATTEYLPTPPSSVSSETSGNGMNTLDESPTQEREETIIVRYASPTYEGPSQKQPSFRLRRGRGGRLLVDRRGFRMQTPEEDIDLSQRAPTRQDLLFDRFKYDQDDEDEQMEYIVDPYDPINMRFRASVLPISHGDHQRQIQAQSMRRMQHQDAPMAGTHPAAVALHHTKGQAAVPITTSHLVGSTGP